MTRMNLSATLWTALFVLGTGAAMLGCNVASSDPGPKTPVAVPELKHIPNLTGTRVYQKSGGGTVYSADLGENGELTETPAVSHPASPPPCKTLVHAPDTTVPGKRTQEASSMVMIAVVMKVNGETMTSPKLMTFYGQTGTIMQKDEDHSRIASVTAGPPSPAHPVHLEFEEDSKVTDVMDFQALPGKPTSFTTKHGDAERTFTITVAPAP